MSSSWRICFILTFAIRSPHVSSNLSPVIESLLSVVRTSFCFVLFFELLFLIYFFFCSLPSFYYSVVDLQCSSISVVQQSNPVIHICTLFFIFLYYLPSCSNPRDQMEFLVFYNRTSLPIHSKCNSLNLLTPNSQSIPLTPCSP